jgi:uroporphyrinogen III methyltransferase/synthase
MNAPRVYLVGAGPGAPDLITLRARDVLRRADVVVYDRLAAPELLGLAPDAEHIYVGKTPGAHGRTQEQISRLLVELARSGRTIVRLKGGDPFVFGRGGEEALELAAAGIPFEVVPGVTAAVAAGATAGIPVTHRGLAACVAFVTGHEDPAKDQTDLDWPGLAAWPGTLVFYMGVGNLGAICKRLVRHGMDPERPAAAVQRATTPRQKTVTATVATLDETVREAGIRPPAVCIFGPVVSLQATLAWFESRPLFGRTVVSTRPAARACGLTRALRELGARVLEAPSIAIEPARDPAPLRDALGRADEFDWLVLTSAEGVRAVGAALQEAARDARALAPLRICVIGPATAQALRDLGLRPDLMPEAYTSAAIAEALPARESLQGKRILCARADIAPPALTDALREAGADVRSVTAYHVVAAAFDPAPVRRALQSGEPVWITFTSPSTAENFLAAVSAEELRKAGARIASIGPVTSEALRRLGLPPHVEADPHTADGLVEAILGQTGPDTAADLAR